MCPLGGPEGILKLGSVGGRQWVRGGKGWWFRILTETKIFNEKGHGEALSPARTGTMFIGRITWRCNALREAIPGTLHT